MIDFRTVRPGTKLFIPFATYDSNDPSASVTLTGLATTDIEIYKDDSMTQRGSDNGYALVDTDGIDIDGLTGIHGFTIDLADNTTAGFYAAGSQYTVVVASITVDAGVVNFIAATFRIGYDGAVHNTTIATLASQTSFTLTAGPAEDNALVGMVVIIHDVASAVQIAQGVVQAYQGSTKTVTLSFDPAIFTMAAGDNISFFPGVNVRYISEDKTAADNAEAAFDGTGYAGGTIKQKVDLDTIKTQTVTCAAGVTILASVGTAATATAQTGDVYALANGASGFVAIKGETAAILADTGTDGVVVAAASKTGYSLTATTGLGNQTANINGSVASVTGAVGSVAAGGIASTSFAAGAINAAAIADAAIDNATFAADVGSTAYASNIIALAVRKVLDELNLDHLISGETPIDGKSWEAAVKYIASVVAGKASDAGTGTEKFYGLDGTTERVRVTADASGNRTAVTYDPV